MSVLMILVCLTFIPTRSQPSNTTHVKKQCVHCPVRPRPPSYSADQAAPRESGLARPVKGTRLGFVARVWGGQSEVLGLVQGDLSFTDSSNPQI